MNRRGFFGTLAALVALPWVGRKAKPAPLKSADIEKMFAVMQAHQKSYLRQHAQMVADFENGVMTANEVRAFHGRPPLRNDFVLNGGDLVQL